MNHSCGSHSTEGHFQFSDTATLRMEGDVEGSVDDGDIILATSRLLISGEIFITPSGWNGYGDEHLETFHNSR